jgi:hypothetical protein
MFWFDLEYVHVMGQQWNRAGFSCRRRQPIDDHPLGLPEVFGFAPISGFTSNAGRLINQELRIAYPEASRPSFAEKCICFDPATNSDQANR